MEKPMNKWMIWGTIIFGNTQLGKQFGYLFLQFRSIQGPKIVYHSFMTLSLQTYRNLPHIFHGYTAQEIMLYHQNDTESWQKCTTPS